jgi:TnpA family transposase
MAVSFLNAAQRDRYGRYPDVVTPDDLSRCFHLSDDDRAQIMSCRGHHNRLGFALQLTTVRYLGTFLDDPTAVPSSVLQSGVLGTMERRVRLSHWLSRGNADSAL